MAAEAPRSADENNDYLPRQQDSNIPVPDPTRLTTQLVDRALAAFREVMETRLSSIDRATELSTKAVEAIPELADRQREHARIDIARAAESLREILEEKIGNVSDVTAEKFRGIDKRFEERDERVNQAAQESRISLDAALSAAKEAVEKQQVANKESIDKSELNTQKQIDSLTNLMTTQYGALDEKINDIKSRLDRGEGQTTGGKDTRLDTRANFGLALASVSSLVAVIGLVVVAFVK